MNSFNVYGQTETQIGGHTPVWLGTVKPIPVGAVLEKTEVPDKFKKDGKIFIPAGTPVVYIPNFREFFPATNLEDASAYLYNDICADNNDDTQATGAMVMHHPEGLLISRVLPDIDDLALAQLQIKIPGVLLVHDRDQE